MSILKITNSNFQEEVLNSSKPVLLDFYANWCGPCQMMGPVMEEIAAERPDVKVGKIDVDMEGELARRFNVMSIPMLVVVKDGKVVHSSTGARPKAAVLNLL